MIGKDVEVIEYPRKVDMWNCLTHAVGAVLSVTGLLLMLIKADDARHFAAAFIFGLSLVAVYTMSAVYHGLPCSEAKRRARLADHCTVPLLIAGTATPCVLIILFDLDMKHGWFVLILAWSCTAFGIFTRLFFFEKLKNLTVGVYIASGILMLVSVIPLLKDINSGAFGRIVTGCMFYLAGAVFCLLGVKKPWLHVVFHLFVLLGSVIHFYAVYTYMF
ncbi:MAG: hemolysin III family protein [Clostridia bacterium]|nr:hemolysin III family protein [Clostridia bacterium]